MKNKITTGFLTMAVGFSGILLAPWSVYTDYCCVHYYTWVDYIIDGSQFGFVSIIAIGSLITLIGLLEKPKLKINGVNDKRGEE
jgi:nitrate reductase gamma subunit